MTHLTAVFIIAGTVIFINTLKNRSFGMFFLSALCGFCALIASYLIGRVIGTDIPITAFAVSVGAIGGIPGVILLVAMITVFDVLK